MTNSRRGFLALTILSLYSASQPALLGAPTHVVVSQVYGGGGNAGAVYKNDFIELYNPTASAVSLAGWSVQYAGTTATTWVKTDLSGSIQAGHYYLIQEAAGAGGTTNLPAPDASGGIAMAAGAGKVALLNTNVLITPLTVCPAGAAVIDKVGYGTGTNCFEGSGPTATLANTTAALRKKDGSGVEIDNDTNSADFLAGTPSPGNSSGRAPIGAGAANPASVPPGTSTLLSVAVTPGAGPTSTGLGVSGDLNTIGGSSTQAFFDDGTNGDVTAGDNVFSVDALVAPATAAGGKLLPFTVSDGQSRSSSGSITLTVTGVVPPSSTLVISQIYGGGGNAGATLTNDFIELYNLGSTTMNVTGWSVQYSSAAGTTWQKTDLTGTIQPGRYYLVQEAQGAGGTNPLPTPDAIGTIPMAAGSGKIALVSSPAALTGSCPSAGVVDFVGYGTANCSETTPMPGLSNTTAGIRKGNGGVDTNNNLNDFIEDSPSPHNSSGFPPTGSGSATPSSASPGESTLLTVAVTPGQFPGAGGLGVTADLTALGGIASQTFLDDGSNGDAVAHDNIFSYEISVAPTTTAGPKSLIATITDALARHNTAGITFAVETTLSAIHDIQGSGTFSSAAAQFITTRGIVTGKKSNGFFVQVPDADVDSDPTTSEGIFVFTGGAPPANAAPGNLVKVSGTVTEFIPSADPVSPSITEIGGGSTAAVAVRLLTTGNALPMPVTLTPADTNPAGSREQLERFEGMRVRVGFLRVIAPTQAAFVDEANATSTSNGVFYGVIEGLPRPLREPGIELPDPLPAGAPCCVPRFDANPERLRVDSDGLTGGSPIEVTAGALVSNLIGPLDYSFRTYVILPDPASPPSVSNVGSAVAVPIPDANEFTVGAFNMERFFDTTDDPTVDDVALTPAAFETRLKKASLAIRHVMLAPDVVGVEEMENLSTLQAVAARVNSDAVTAGEPDPMYEAYLFEGNDIGGIDSGVLVKRARVIPLEVTQEGKDTLFTNPDGSSAPLNDRPTVVLRAEIRGPLGTYFPVTVLVNHLRSLSGVDGTDGVRIRAKRRAQAEFLANLIQARQLADPAERIVSVGDYNAFQFSDGYVDSIGTIKGTPTPADEVVLASPDLVDPNLTNLIDRLPAAERYSFSFDGNGQVLDQMLVNPPMLDRFSRIQFARNDADFPESFRGDPNRPERVSDHDMPVAYFFFYRVPQLTLMGSNPMTVEAGTSFTDPGATAHDDDLGDLTSQIHVSGEVDAQTPGSYTLTYSVTNGLLTTTITRTVNVVDTTPPVLLVAGSNPMTVEGGSPFVDPGATANDSVAHDLTGSIVASGLVDTSHVGSYTRTYSVSDGYNTASATRTVNVVDTTAPVITLAGANPMTIEAGSAFVDPGATARDSLAGDLTAAIVASGAVDVNHVGSYRRTYTVDDGYNSASATRTVIVVDTIGPAVSAPSASPSSLWPPNHKMIDVTVSYSASDAGSPVTSTLSVTSNEPTNGQGDGDTAPDWEVIDATHLRLRAERAGGGNGRIYTITVTSRDASGNTTVRAVAVKVPKNGSGQ